MHLCINMLIFTHNLGNWLIGICGVVTALVLTSVKDVMILSRLSFCRQNYSQNCGWIVV